MCRNIRNLYNFKPPATEEEIHASSLQFVRKLSGFNRPSKANEEAFNRAVEAAAARELIASLVTTAPRSARPVDIEVDAERRVSGLLQMPARAACCYVLAHGAGAGMAHPFMAAVAELAERGIATLRFQFPYMEQRGRRPDPPALAQATVRAAVAKAGALARGLPLIAGGKSFGGRMISQAQAAEAFGGVRGLAFLGFPLHPAGKPSAERAKHLVDVKLPMLFLQGTRDALADLGLLRPVVAGLGKRATLRPFDEADHSFHVPARTGRKDAEVRREMLDALAAWAEKIAAG